MVLKEQHVKLNTRLLLIQNQKKKLVEEELEYFWLSSSP